MEFLLSLDNRTYGRTNANEHSSRSHTILKITVESRSVSEEDGTVRVASLVSIHVWCNGIMYAHLCVYTELG